MNPKQLTILAVLVAIAGGVFFMVNSKQTGAIHRDDVQKIGDRAVPKFDVASITSLSIAKTGQEVTLKREGENWGVVERENFVADATKIRGVLYALRDMKISESRNMRGPNALKALELLDPEPAGKAGTGTGTTVRYSGGGESGVLVFGKNFSSAIGRGGRFIRTADGAVYVASTALANIETDPPSWLDRKEFFAVENSKTITVTHEKPEDSYTLTRETEGSSLALDGASESEELHTDKIGQFGSLLSNVKFVDYVVGDAAKPEKTGLEKPVTATIDTFDGFKYLVSVGNKSGSQQYLSFQVSAAIAEAPAEVVPPAPEEGKELTEEEKAKQEADKLALETQRAEVTRLKTKLAAEQKFAGKIYLVDGMRVQPVLQKRSELIKTEEEKKAEAEAEAEEDARAAASGGGNGRVTATTPPVAVDPKILEAERLKQEKKVRDAAAIQKMLDDLKREKAEAAAKDAGDEPEAETADGEKPEEGNAVEGEEGGAAIE